MIYKLQQDDRQCEDFQWEELVLLAAILLSEYIYILVAMESLIMI